ncbi:MAG: hypothetical protein ACJZ8D_03715 [Candidatus Pelagibacter sp.]
MQKKKTGKLFNFCLYAVGVIANKTTKEKKIFKQSRRRNRFIISIV